MEVSLYWHVYKYTNQNVRDFEWGRAILRSTKANTSACISDAPSNRGFTIFLKHMFYVHTFVRMYLASYIDILERWEVPPINIVSRQLDKLERRIKEQEDSIDRVK